MVVHESPQYIVVDDSPPPPPRPNTVGHVPPPPSPRHRQVAYIEHVQGIPHLVRPSSGGGLGGRHPSSGGAPAPVAARPTPPSRPAGGPLVPPWQGGLLGGAVVGHLLLVEGGVHPFDILGAPLLHGGRKTYSTPVAVPGVWCTTKRASNL